MPIDPFFIILAAAVLVSAIIGLLSTRHSALVYIVTAMSDEEVDTYIIRAPDAPTALEFANERMRAEWVEEWHDQIEVKIAAIIHLNTTGILYTCHTY